MSAPCSFSESPKAKIPPSAIAAAVFVFISPFGLIQSGPRPRIETCHVYQ